MESKLRERIQRATHATLNDFTEYNIWDYTAEPGIDCIDPMDYWMVLEELEEASIV